MYKGSYYLIYPIIGNKEAGWRLMYYITGMKMYLHGLFFSLRTEPK